MDKTESKTINLLRFPLAVMVVFAHTPPNIPLTALIDTKYPIMSGTFCYNIIEITFSHILSQVAVYLFFIFSGYLFFQKLTSWNWSVWKGKIKKRVFSLLIPYLLWILLAFVSLTFPPVIAVLLNTSSLELCYQNFMENDCTFIKCFWNFYTWRNAFTNIWGIHIINQVPIIGPFWFIRDLMTAILFSPLLYYLFRTTKIYGIFFLIIIYLFDLCPTVQGVSFTAFLFFGIGAFIAMKNQSLVNFATRQKIPATIIAAICYITILLYHGKTNVGPFPLSKIYEALFLSSVWTIIYLGSIIVEKYDVKPNKILLNSCFFIYALHAFPFLCKGTTYSVCGYFTQIVTKCFHGIPHTELLCYITPPFVTICFCLILQSILSRTNKRINNLLIGNRKI